jgi:hypothetical protein
MENNIDNYSHLIEIDEGSRQLAIYRVSPNGQKSLFTSAELPSQKFLQDEGGFRKFACRLGENLLFDSPVARRLLDL